MRILAIIFLGVLSTGCSSTSATAPETRIFASAVGGKAVTGTQLVKIVPASRKFYPFGGIKSECTVTNGSFSREFTAPKTIRVPVYGIKSPKLRISCRAADGRTGTETQGITFFIGDRDSLYTKAVKAVADHPVAVYPESITVVMR
jgi:hypothetical protein